MSPTRTAARSSLPLAVASAVLVTGAGLALAPSADAAVTARTPCPKLGTFLGKDDDAGAGTRVWHTGSKLRACVKRDRRRRVVRTIGRWNADTLVAVGGTSVAWTVRRTENGRPVDGVRTTVVRTGTRWLARDQAVPRASPSGTTSDDRIVGLRSGRDATAWVTASGTVDLALRRKTTGGLATTPNPGSDAMSTPVATYADGLAYRLLTVPAAEARATVGRLDFYAGGGGFGRCAIVTYGLAIGRTSVTPALAFPYVDVAYGPSSGEGC